MDSLEIGCTYYVGLAFERNPSYDDILVSFSQGDKEVIRYGKNDFDVSQKTDEDGNTFWYGQLKLDADKTKLFFKGVATCRVYAIVGSDIYPSYKHQFFCRG